MKIIDRIAAHFGYIKMSAPPGDAIVTCTPHAEVEVQESGGREPQPGEKRIVKNQKADIDLLFAVADRLFDNHLKAALNNLIAEVVMGWHTDSSDARQLWRDASGLPITRDIEGEVFTICRHPWRREANADFDCSFNPIFNHHRTQICWRSVVYERVASECSR